MAGPKSNEHRTKLVSRALSRLVELIVAPTGANEDTVRAAYDWAESVIMRHSLPSPDGDDAEIRFPRVKQSADLIKKKLIREYTSPEKALRFTNLYSRLLTQSVLHQKWTMLYLLYLLSEPPPPEVSQPSYFDTVSSPITAAVTSGPPISRIENSYSRDTRESRLHNTASNPVAARVSSRHRGQQQYEDRPTHSPIIRHATAPAVEVESEPSIDESAKVTEWDLLRDLPFALQGISTSHLHFTTSPPVLNLPATASVPMVGLLHTLAEPALLYSQLSDFVRSSDGGLVEQSFRSALESELTSYLRLIISLENHIRPVLAAVANPESSSLTRADATLKYCALYLRQPTMGLRLLSVMVEQSKDKKGGELISLVYSFATSHGDPFVSSFAQRLLGDVTKPFYNMLQQWIYDGELSDPYHEFFVREQQGDSVGDITSDGRKLGASSVWEEKYVLHEQMVPSIISISFAKKVFLIGKSLNFIRHACADPRWVESYAKTYSRELSFGDNATLENSIGEAYKITMAQLMDLMKNKFALLTHLKALKKYILLGAGDFIAILMESLAPNLDRPANSQYRHTLTAQLEHAVRNSNAQYEPDEVLKRLDSRMLELSHGEIGWDVFTLEYKIEPPVDVVVTPFGAKQYLKVFNFLWRVKRVEFSLSTLWRRCMTGARGVLASVSAHRPLANDWKRARGVLAEMIHFVNQLQYYILFEVIESSWADLIEAINRPECTLDDLIQAHARYLTSITRKGLLGNATVDFTAQLHGLLKVMLMYRDAVEGLYSFTVTDFTRRQERQAQGGGVDGDANWNLPLSKTLSKGSSRKPLLPEDDDVDMDDSNPDRPMWNTATTMTNSSGGAPLAGFSVGTGGLGKVEDLGVLPALRTRLQSLGTDYRSKLSTLLADLLHQPDPDMRWLAMVMNFNDVYQPAVALARRKRKLQQQQQQAQAQAQQQAQAQNASRGRQQTQAQAQSHFSDSHHYRHNSHSHPSQQSSSGPNPQNATTTTTTTTAVTDNSISSSSSSGTPRSSSFADSRKRAGPASIITSMGGLGGGGLGTAGLTPGTAPTAGGGSFGVDGSGSGVLGASGGLGTPILGIASLSGSGVGGVSRPDSSSSLGSRPTRLKGAGRTG